MIVNVNDKWRIKSDPHCFVCQEYVGTRWHSRTFHATYETAVEHMVELRLRDDPIEFASMKAALDHIRGIRVEMRDELSNAPGAPLEIHHFDTALERVH